MPPRKTVTASFPPRLLEQIEQARGLISRSAWLQRAAEEFLVGRGALEQEANTPASSGGGPSREVIPGESQRGADVGRGAAYRRDASDAKPAEAASSPARAPVAQRIEGQTTVDEMLASCPNCAEELQPADALSGAAILVCPECSYVRDAT